MKELVIGYGTRALSGKYNNYGDYTRIVIPPTVHTVASSLNHMSKLEEVVFQVEIDKYGNEHSVEYIYDSFNDCKNLKNIIFEGTKEVKIDFSFRKPITLKKVY